MLPAKSGRSDFGPLMIRVVDKEVVDVSRNEAELVAADCRGAYMCLRVENRRTQDEPHKQIEYHRLCAGVSIRLTSGGAFLHTSQWPQFESVAMRSADIISCKLQRCDGSTACILARRPSTYRACQQLRVAVGRECSAERDLRASPPCGAHEARKQIDADTQVNNKERGMKKSDVVSGMKVSPSLTLNIIYWV